LREEEGGGTCGGEGGGVLPAATYGDNGAAGGEVDPRGAEAKGRFVAIFRVRGPVVAAPGVDGAVGGNAGGVLPAARHRLDRP
jgi:hypothetical protein